MDPTRADAPVDEHTELGFTPPSHAGFELFFGFTREPGDGWQGGLRYRGDRLLVKRGGVLQDTGGGGCRTG